MEAARDIFKTGAIRLVEEECMGKGDQRTRKGKIYRGSHGKTRPGRADGKKKK